jgi:thymidylate kinase
VARRAAIVGIDGSGKSALVHRLRERIGHPPSRLVALNCPRYHDTPDAPLAELSAQLKALSDVADELGSFELKLGALYLRMTLYGPVERFLTETFAPEHLVSDRHPLVDMLAYVPLYGSKVASRLDGGALEPVLRERLGAAGPGALDAALAWHDRENRRLGRDMGFWAIAQDVVESFRQEPPEIVADFGRRFGTALPDVVVLLDVEPQEAARRLAGREAGRQELHESEQALTVVRGTYERVLQQLPELSPGIELQRVSSTGRGVDETLEELLAVAGLPAPEPVG